MFLTDENLKCVHIDCDIIFKEDILATHEPAANENNNQPIKFGSNSCNENEEPLLVNEVDT